MVKLLSMQFKYNIIHLSIKFNNSFKFNYFETINNKKSITIISRADTSRIPLKLLK